MATLLGPFSVGYPVAFRSGGDTTREAFGKHIQEIEKIYGILNALDAGKVSSEDLSGIIGGSIDSKLQAHVNSTNPHPNWKINFSDLTGNLDASKVVGNLTNAYIDASHVNNLASIVSGLIPSGQDKGDGITDSDIKSNGYVKFNNGLIVQWGKTENQYEYVHANTANEHKFKIEFPSQCFTVICQPYMDGATTAGLETMASVVEMNSKGFKFVHDKFANSWGGGERAWWLRYIALGI